MTGQAKGGTGKGSGAAASRPLSVIVVDDHPIWRDTLVSLLQSLEIAGEVRQAGTGRAAVELARATAPDVVVMDMRLPDMSGIAAAAEIRADPGCPVLMLSSSDERRDVLEAVRAGVSGYLVKTALPEEIASALRRVTAGELVLSANITSHVVDELVHGPRADHPLSKLSDRERSVLTLMAEGHSNRAIADQLFMSPKTVEAHVTSIFGKLGLEESPETHRRVQAVVTYLRAQAEQARP